MEAEMRAALLLLIVLLLAAAFRGRLFADRSEHDPATLFKLIDVLIGQRPFTREAVSRITETTLREADSNEYFATFKSVRDAKAPLREVELRLPTAASSKKDGILILSIDTAARITTEAVEKHFGSPPGLSVPEPAAPYEVAYTYKKPWGDLSFEFARRTRYLTAVVIDAIESQPAPTTGDGTAPPERIKTKKWLGTFATYPGARELCSQHVTGNVMHILWNAYATRDTPEEVNAFYLQKEGKEHAEQGKNSLTFRHGDKVLSIHRASAKDYPNCGTPPSPEEKTVMIASQAIRP